MGVESDLMAWKCGARKKKASFSRRGRNGFGEREPRTDDDDNNDGAANKIALLIDRSTGAWIDSVDWVDSSKSGLGRRLDRSQASKKYQSLRSSEDDIRMYVQPRCSPLASRCTYIRTQCIGAAHAAAKTVGGYSRPGLVDVVPWLRAAASTAGDCSAGRGWLAPPTSMV